MSNQLIFINDLPQVQFNIDQTLPYALSCRGPHTQLWTLLRLCALSCRAFYLLLQPKTRTYRLKVIPSSTKTSFSSQKSLPYIFRTSFYIYNPMVLGPWARQNFNIIPYILKGRQPFDLTIHFAHFAESLQYTFTQNSGFKPQNHCSGDPMPNRCILACNRHLHLICYSAYIKSSQLLLEH